MSVGVPSLHFDSTLGAAFLGHFATAILYGITSVQAFIYFRQSPKDPLIYRSLVLVLWLLDSLHAALITASMYYYLVTNLADPFVVERPVWSIWAMIIVSNTSNNIVRGIFSHRIWKLSGRGVLLPLMIGLMSLYVAGDGFYFASKGLQSPSYMDVHDFSWSLYVGFAFEVTADSMITVSQCLLLRRLRTGIRSTDSAILVLIIYSINTGMLTSICAILCLITYTVLPHMFVYFAFYFVLSKLYVNSLLANLNARGILLENIAPPSGQFNKMEISDSSARETSALQPARFSTFIDLSGIVTSANHAITVTEYSEPII